MARRVRPRIQFSNDERKILEQLVRSRVEPHAKVLRAKILLGYSNGKTVSQMAREFNVSRPKIERCI
jgi:DNA-directed RNA polymerase sigma subunit (sigma70/sigma32)